MTRRSALIVVLVAACSGAEVQAPSTNTRHSDPSLLAGVVVTEPLVVSATNTDSSGVTLSSIATPLVYVSLIPGTATGAYAATITNLRTSDTTKVTLQGGGFDPLPITAVVGDSLEVSVIIRYGGTVDAYIIVAADTPPRIVRTNPPRGQTDVPVNTNIIVVFSEPMAAASVNTSSIVLTAGGATISGTVRVLSTSPFTAEFIPDATLAGSTQYVLSVSRTVTDITGNQLDAAASVAFTTAAAPPSSTTLTFAAISAGVHTCALTAAGKAYCWGLNSSGQLGDGSITDRHVPVAVTGGLNFASISVSGINTCGLTLTGAAYCWGGNASGQLGNGTFNSSYVPAPVASGLSFASINAQGPATCAVTATGDAYCWGMSTTGMLGATAAASCAAQGCTLPIKVDGGIAFATVTVGGYSTCGVTAAGAAYCWGLNGYGELGVGTATGPEQCPTFTQYGNFPGTIPCSHAPLAVSGGLSLHAVTAGSFFGCGLTDDGVAHCWGGNNAGQFGDGTRTGATPHADPAPAAGGLRFRTLSPGNQFICGIALDGQTYCWGGNSDGASGVLGCRQGGSSCFISAPNLIPGGLAFATVSAAGGNACGLTASGKAYCWGNNVYGGLGNNSTTPSFVPVAVGPPQ